jgi:hypothetical protein
MLYHSHSDTLIGIICFIQYVIIDIAVMLLLYLGTHEEVGSQLLSHLDSGMHISDCSNIKDLQPSQKGEERVEMLVHEDIQSGEEIFTDSSMLQHPGSSGKQTDLQNLCTETVTHVGDTAVNLRDIPETWDTAVDYIDSDEYQDSFIPHEPCTVATDTWEYLPSQLCRLCASTDEHPKQSIVGWLGMLNEIIPDLVSYLSLLIFMSLYVHINVCRCGFSSLHNDTLIITATNSICLLCYGNHCPSLNCILPCYEQCNWFNIK